MRSATATPLPDRGIKDGVVVPVVEVGCGEIWSLQLRRDLTYLLASGGRKQLVRQNTLHGKPARAGQCPHALLLLAMGLCCVYFLA